jgi:hypothetical protein
MADRLKHIAAEPLVPKPRHIQLNSLLEISEVTSQQLVKYCQNRSKQGENQYDLQSKKTW